MPPPPIVVPSPWVTLLIWAVPLLVWGGVAFMIYMLLRSELSPKRIVSLFESEGSLSIRLVLATVVVLYTLHMETKKDVNILLVEANLAFAATLLGLGAAKIVGKAFAERPPETTVNSKKTELHADKVVNNATDAPAKEEFNMNNLS